MRRSFSCIFLVSLQWMYIVTTWAEPCSRSELHQENVIFIISSFHHHHSFWYSILCKYINLNILLNTILELLFFNINFFFSWKTYVFWKVLFERKISQSLCFSLFSLCLPPIPTPKPAPWQLAVCCWFW